MRKKVFTCLNKFIVVAVLCLLIVPFQAQGQSDIISPEEIEKKVLEIMEEGKIPGLSLVIIKGDQTVLLKGLGYADLENKKPVTPDTLFELASCSKSFTGLAALKLEEKGHINLDDPVSKYIPWFHGVYEGITYDKITIRQVLYQTSGIATNSVGLIPQASGADALEKTVRTLEGIELKSIPGTTFEYATMNYDIIGRIVEVVSKKSFEEYMREEILMPLGLNSTIVGVDYENPAALKALGYKIGFFEPRVYNSPVFRGNNPAGYVVSSGRDIATYLKLHLGVLDSDFTHLAQKSHQMDTTVPPSMGSLTSYGMGWSVSVSGSGQISHDGYNPNFTAFLGFNHKAKIGVAVMANCDSDTGFTAGYIGDWVMAKLTGAKFDTTYEYSGGVDKSSSVAVLFLGFFALSILAFIIILVSGIVTGNRKFEKVSLSKLGRMLATPLLLVPFIYGVILIPEATYNADWSFMSVWGPSSLMMAIYSLIGCLALCYFAYLLSTVFPTTNKYVRSAPMLILLSLLNGGANAVVIFLISSSLYSPVKLSYMMYYFALAMFAYIGGRKVMQTKMIGITLDIVYDMRMKLFNKIFLTSYEKFESLDRGRVYATLNDDTNQIGNSANLFVALISSIITVIGCFMYLAAIAFWATAVTIGVIVAIAALYYVVGQKAEVYFEQARDTRNVFMRLLNGMLDGFKELSLHIRKKDEYKADLEVSCDEFRKKSYVAMIKFINAFLIGESMLILVLGAVGFAIPKIFPNIETMILMAFIMVLLYLIGPITGILNSIPGMMQLKIAWGRVQGFLKDIPANIDASDLAALGEKKVSIDSLVAKDVMFSYDTQEEDEAGFSVGPINIEAKKGEIVFIVGGNGSGKTTLAKLLTGLYIPENGSITVNGKEISNYELGEYYSSVFSGFHLFEKLYNIDIDDKRDEANEYLKLLRMAEKVEINGDTFSSINLSGGQRKRLALLQCYLEDCPIYIFDELAADQDPEFRKFFYRDLLLRMKEKGKIVIAVTHDDHYFDVADKVIKMDMGKVDDMSAEEYQKLSK